jgi:hypothetical protein
MNWTTLDTQKIIIEPEIHGAIITVRIDLSTLIFVDTNPKKANDKYCKQFAPTFKRRHNTQDHITNIPERSLLPRFR